MARIRLTHRLAIETSELKFDFIRASGPGGQNVNRVATAVQLRFDLRGSPNLPPEVKDRAARLAGHRLTGEGEIVIEAKSHRSQKQNRREAVDRLTALLTEAAGPPPRARRPTRPTRAAREKRLKNKKMRSQLKSRRRRPPDGD